MFEDYFKEFAEAETLKSENAFCVFRTEGDSFFIEHFYAKPEHRGRNGASHALFEELKALAKERGKNMITTSCDQRSPTWRQAHKAHLNAGFKVSAVVGTVIYTYYEIQHEETPGEK